MKLMVHGAGAVAAAGASMALFGSGVAAAQDVVGMRWSDAQEAIEEEELEPVVATRVGDKLETDDCWVTMAQEAPEDRMLVSLNCYDLAAPESPGISAGNNNLAQQAIKDAIEEEEAESEEGVTTEDER